MFIRLRIRRQVSRDEPIKKPSGYPFRISSGTISVLIHCAFVFSFAFVPTYGARVTKRNAKLFYDAPVLPSSHKLYFYDLRNKLPDVAPTKKIGNLSQPHGAEESKQTIVANSPNAKSVQQIISVPAPKVEVRRDVPLPNLIAKLNSSLPTLPDLPKQKERASAESIKIAQTNSAPVQPKGELNRSSDNLAGSVPEVKPPKLFIAPKHVVAEPKLPLPVIDAPTPTVAATAMDPRLAAATSTAAFGRGIAAPPTAPVAPISSTGDARADIAIAGLHPDEKSKELPDGDRAGRFSKAPLKGEDASGEASKFSITIPNLMTREDKTTVAKAPDPAPNLKTVFYAERVRSTTISTLSLPLRPNSRSIPRGVDEIFHGRTVYTLVVPIENLPAYSGDWIMWFAERDSKQGDSPMMRAPLPYRKLELVDGATPGNQSVERVQISGILDRSGKLSKISMATKADPAVDQVAIQDLKSWEFKPATRNGIAVEVDVVIEIMFNLPPALAKRARP